MSSNLKGFAVLIWHLRDKRHTVLSLMDAAELNETTVRRHLKVLEDMELATRIKQGAPKPDLWELAK